MAKKPIEESSTRTRVSQSEFPNMTLENALRIGKAIWEHFAGKGAAPHNIALALDLSPTSGGWRNLGGAAIAYGITEGGYNAQQITLTELGRRIVAPTREGDDRAALREAIQKPRVGREFFQKYNRAKFPRDDIAKNVLVELGLPKERAEEALSIMRANGKLAGAIIETKTGMFVALDSDVDPSAVNHSGEVSDITAPNGEENNIDSFPERLNEKPRNPISSPRHLFVAHGKNRKPLEEIKKILDQFKIPYKVAVDEAHAGRPISKKVADLMKECSAGIFIFTRDEKFFDEDKNEVWRSSENVVYELGAANVLWESKIIIVKEDGVYFPSDFKDLGYISFDASGVSGKALDILRELVGLGLVRVQAAE